MTILLVGEAGPYAGSRFELGRGEHIVGRRDRCAVGLLHDKKVSREHAVIDVGREGARLTDAGSRNGSFVNDERIIEQSLQAGDTVRFGDSVFRVEVLNLEEAGETSSPLAEPGPDTGPFSPTERKPEEEKAPPVVRVCPSCGEKIPPNQTYGVCAFCACNLMPLFKGLVRTQQDVAGTQRLTCSNCGNLIADYSQMTCSACRLNFVTGRFPDGTTPGQAAPLTPAPLPSSPEPAPPPATRRGCGLGLLLWGGLILSGLKELLPWLSQ